MLHFQNKPQVSSELCSFQKIWNLVILWKWNKSSCWSASVTTSLCPELRTLIKTGVKQIQTFLSADRNLTGIQNCCLESRMDDVTHLVASPWFSVQGSLSFLTLKFFHVAPPASRLKSRTQLSLYFSSSLPFFPISSKVNKSRLGPISIAEY